jgi:hypothetical protein
VYIVSIVGRHVLLARGSRVYNHGATRKSAEFKFSTIGSVETVVLILHSVRVLCACILVFYNVNSICAHKGQHYTNSSCCP